MSTTTADWIDALGDAGLVSTDDLGPVDGDDAFPYWLARWEAFRPVRGGYLVASRPFANEDGYLALITTSGVIRSEVRHDLTRFGLAVLVAAAAALEAVQ